MPLAKALAQAPAIIQVAPLANAHATVRTEPLRFSFDQPLTLSSGDALQVFSAQRGGRRTRLEPASVHDNSLHFTPNRYAFMPGETVSYTVTPAAASVRGHLARPLVGQFTTAVSCQGTGVFQPSSGLQVGHGAGITMGDLDSDGDLDVVVANFSAVSNTVSVRLNDGTGSFYGTQELPVGQGPERVTLSDIDGDGDVDILTTNQVSNTVSVRLNDGMGGFSSGSELAVQIYPTRVVVGDVDADGDLDLVITSFRGYLQVRLNDGTGSFVKGQEVVVASSLSDAALGDIDGDGDLDVAITSLYAGTVSLCLNDGTGQFTTNSTLQVGSEPHALALADVTGDGQLDLLVPSGSTSTAGIYPNTGGGSFGPGQVVPVGIGPYNLAVGDIDGDGDLDFLTADYYGNVSVCRNDGKGSFTAGGTQVLTISSPADLTLGDVDGDGDLDLLASGNTFIQVHLNGGTGPLPTGKVQLTGPDHLCAGEVGRLTALSSPLPQAYHWSTGETTASIALPQPGTYAVTVTFANCQTASAEYTVAACVRNLLLPNVVTANGDQHNDYFTPVGLAAGTWALVICNRWGREVYRTEDYQGTWGAEAAAGLYYYQLQQVSSATVYRGWFEVVR